MRNLKKILALVLAVSMLLSMTAFAGFTDAAKIDEDYAEAVAVLSDMGIFKGYDNGAFGPKDTLTRAQVAAIIYRIATGDVEDEKVDLFVGAANFSDVPATEWYAGYIGYCASAGYVLGCGDGTFNPNGKVTGFEALAMILRVMGYDAQKEFTGALWTEEISKVATKADLLEDIKPGMLATAASREMIAQLLFSCIQADTVRYTPAFGYHTGYESLGEENFDLAGPIDTTDKWGRPGYKYTYSTGEESTAFSIAPVVTYTEAVTECEVAVDASIKTTKTYDLYVNGVKSSDTIAALDTVDTIGAQGRLTEVYKDRIVMIDTFLAKVVSVADATYDARGHIKTESKIVLEVYDGYNTAYTMYNGKTNYKYAEGDYVLINAYTKTGDRDNAGQISKVYGTILGLADAMVGTQSVIWYNSDKHTINNVTYYDAAEFNLNVAANTTDAYTWFFDQYGNVIGNAEIKTQYDYAVIKNIWWAGNSADGTGVAKATLIYMDGSENVVTLAKVEGATPAYSTDVTNVMTISGTKFYVATNVDTNTTLDGAADMIKGHLYSVKAKADGSVELAKVTTELASATIVNKYAYIENVKIDLDTQFLVRGAAETSSFKVCVGMNMLPSFKAGAKVDYVLGDDGVAKFVYIIGSTVDSSSSDFVLVVDNAYSAVLKTAGGVNYWELNLPVPAEDGSVITVKTQSDDVLTKLTSATSVGKLWYVTYTNGYATSADEITTMPYGYTTYGRAIMLDQTAVYAAGVIESGAYRFNVTSATFVVGELSADMTDKVVYVIYDGRDVVASKIYVLDINEEITPVAPVAPTQGTVVYRVTMLADGQENVVKTASVAAAPGTYTGNSFATAAATFWSEIVVENWNVLIDANEVTVVAGQTTLVEYVIKAK